MPTPINIETLRPMEEVNKRQEETEKKDNERKAQNIELNNSQPARVIGEIAEQEFIRLFEEFVKTDTAGAAILTILDRIRGKAIDARHASRLLRDRHLNP